MSSKQRKKTETQQPQPENSAEQMYKLAHYPAVQFGERIIARGEVISESELQKMDKCVHHAFVKV